jgi:hypothetical protein
MPPRVKANDAEVVRFVAQTPEAIGYVARSTDLPPGVVVLEIDPGR